MSANSTFTELVSTTFRKHRKEITDNISNNNALLARLMKKGNKRTENGGLSIVEPLDYAENGTYQRYSGYDILNVSASDVISAAEYQWRQVAVHITASGLELRTNSGDSRIINLAKARIKNAIRTFKNNFSNDVYSDGTLSNQIGGLQKLIDDTPSTGTVGGIDASTWSFWRNVLQSAASPLQGGAGITPSSSTIESLMLPLWLNCSIGNDSPDLIVMDDTYFTFYEESQTSLKRYTRNDRAQGGFISLAYKSADVIYDGDSGIPDSHGYFINTDHIHLVAHPDADISIMDELTSYNQDAVVIPVLFMGNMTCSSRRTQGVMKA